MACVVALLLASAKLQTPNRMVLVTNEQSDYSYTVITQISKLLPAPENTYMKSLPIQHSSTTSAVYCSLTLSSEAMVKSISNSAKEAKDQENNNDNDNDNNDESESKKKECLENINTIAKKKWITKVHSSELDKSLCQTKTLIDLFHQGEISFPRKYNKIFPKNNKSGTRRIVIDKKIDIRDLVYDGQVYQNVDCGRKLSSLAWYRGNLHIFKIGKHGWYPLTKIGKEALNGPMIYLFMLGTNTELWNAKRIRPAEIDNALKILALTKQISNFYNGLMLSHIPVSPQVQMKLAKLKAISPVGEISTK